MNSKSEWILHILFLLGSLIGRKEMTEGKYPIFSPGLYHCVLKQLSGETWLQMYLLQWHN